MSGLNRAVLAVLGAIMIVAGVLVGMITTGVLGQLLGASGTGLVQPMPAAPIVPMDLSRPPTMITAILAGAGVVLVALGLWWLQAQLPRGTAPNVFRMHTDAASGLTVVEPRAINQAIERQLATLPGIVEANASVRGAVQAPHVTLRVTVDERADIAEVVRLINSEVARDLALAFDSTIDQLGVLIDIGRQKHTAQVAAL